MIDLLTPNPYVLPNYIQPDDQKKLNNYSEALEKLVALGTHCYSNLWNQGFINQEVDLVIEAAFKRILELVDSIAILVKVGSIVSAHTQLRALLELVLTFEYLLETDIQRRAYSYIITDTHAIIDYHTNPKITPIVTIPAADLQNLRNVISHPIFANEEAEYAKKSVTRKGKFHHPKWYNLFSNLASFKDLAIHLNREHFYTILYGYTSSYTHGTALLVGSVQSHTNGNVGLTGMREYKEALEFTQTTFQIAKIAFESMTKCIDKTFYEEYIWYFLILMKQHKKVTLSHLA